MPRRIAVLTLVLAGAAWLVWQLAGPGRPARTSLPPEDPDADRKARVARVLADRSVAPVARVLYVGLDGADWQVIDRLIQGGDLPTLARLVREGVRADLLSYEPMMSPLLWTTAVTGRPPDHHGIFDFTVSHGDQQAPITSRFRKTPALWEILGTAGQTSAFVNFWATHPAEQVDGVLVSDIVTALVRDSGSATALPASATWPPGFMEGATGLWTTDDVPPQAVREYAPSVTDGELDAARAYWADAALRAAWTSPTGRKMPPVAFLLQLAAGTHNLERITLDLLKLPEFGVVGLYLGNIDQVGHNFQHLAPPEHPLADADERRRFSDVVDNCYRAQDALLGRLVAAVDDRTVVLIHSDHGFRWGAHRPGHVLPFTRGQPVEWHRLQGILLAAGGPVRRGARIDDATLYDIAPTLLALRGLPPGQDMPGRVRTDLFVDPQAVPATRTPSWDPLVPPRRYSTETDGLDEARAELVERLRALGYVGGDAETPGAGEEADAAGDLTEDRPRVTYHRNKATWLMNQDRFAEAEQALLKANRMVPLPKTYSLLSEARAAGGDVPGAIAALEEGFERFPDLMPAAAALWLVELHLESGDPDGARRAADRGVATFGTDVAPLIVARGRIAEAAGDAAAAREAYLRALEADPREVRAAQRYATLAGSPAERARLEPYVRRALQMDQRIELYWQMLGLILMDGGDPATAADAFGRAAELDQGDAANRINEAVAPARAGQMQRARRIYETLAARGSREAAVWVNLGNLRARESEWRGALEAWERAQELGAQGARIQAAIDEARARLGRGGP